MGPERRVVKEWLKAVNREELDAMLQAAIFTPDEQKYIHMRLIEGMTFKEIAIDAQSHSPRISPRAHIRRSPATASATAVRARALELER